MKRIKIPLIVSLVMLIATQIKAQAIRIPGNTNFTCSAGRKIGATDIQIKWNAPGVKGREEKIWGTDIVPFGFTVLGFGSNNPSPWRAGADECTTISFSTDVKINGANLAAGKYGFFIAVYPDSCVLIFNKNTEGWGSYFYNKDLDVLHVTTKQQKNIPAIKERLEYNFSNQKEDAIETALEWEHWRIPFTVSINLKETVLADIQKQLSSAIGFDPPSLEAGANWCLTNNVNFEQALGWINASTMPSLGGKNTFTALNIKAGILEKLGKADEAKTIKQQALDNATAMELHGYGRSLLAAGKKEEALKVFEMNYNKNAGVWPTNMGMMRAYSAMGNYKKALEHAKKAFPQAPDDINKKNLKIYIETLEKGEPIK